MTLSSLIYSSMMTTEVWKIQDYTNTKKLVDKMIAVVKSAQNKMGEEKCRYFYFICSILASGSSLL